MSGSKCRALQEQEQEVDPGWFGGKFMRGFQAQQDPRQRLLAAREARPHGTINAHTMRALKQAQAAQQIRMWEGWEVTAAHRCTAEGQSGGAQEGKEPMGRPSKHGPAGGTGTAAQSCQDEPPSSAAAHDITNSSEGGAGGSTPALQSEAAAEAVWKGQAGSGEQNLASTACNERDISKAAQHSPADATCSGARHEASNEQKVTRLEEPSRQLPEEGSLSSHQPCWSLQLQRCKVKPTQADDSEVNVADATCPFSA